MIGPLLRSLGCWLADQERPRSWGGACPAPKALVKGQLQTSTSLVPPPGSQGGGVPWVGPPPRCAPHRTAVGDWAPCLPCSPGARPQVPRLMLQNGSLERGGWGGQVRGILAWAPTLGRVALSAFRQPCLKTIRAKHWFGGASPKPCMATSAGQGLVQGCVEGLCRCLPQC